MYDHIGLHVADLGKSVRFYTSALKSLGHVLGSSDESYAGIGPEGSPALWLYRSEGGSRSKMHMAFSAKDM